MVYLAAIPSWWCVEIINERGIMMIGTGCTGHFRIDLLELPELCHWQLHYSDMVRYMRRHFLTTVPPTRAMAPHTE